MFLISYKVSVLLALSSIVSNFISLAQILRVIDISFPLSIYHIRFMLSLQPYTFRDRKHSWILPFKYFPTDGYFIYVIHLC